MPKKLALVTGAAGGLGRAICARLAAEGWSILALDLSAPADTGAYHWLTADIRSRAALAELAAGLDCPDLLVNCAGITRDGVSWKLSEEDWRAVIEVNLTGAANVFSVFAGRMRARGSGVVVNISSINGARGKFGQSNYVAAKAGLEGLTRAWAIEMGRSGVRVNAVAPGMVETELTRRLPAETLERAAAERLLPWAPTPGDIAAAVSFLASEDARCITGQVLNVECGQLTG